MANGSMCIYKNKIVIDVKPKITIQTIVAWLFKFVFPFLLTAVLLIILLSVISGAIQENAGPDRTVIIFGLFILLFPLIVLVFFLNTFKIKCLKEKYVVEPINASITEAMVFYWFYRTYWYFRPFRVTIARSEDTDIKQIKSCIEREFNVELNVIRAAEKQ